MHFLQAINSDLSVLIVCNKTGGTIKGDIKKYIFITSRLNNIGTELSLLNLLLHRIQIYEQRDLNFGCFYQHLEYIFVHLLSYTASA